MSSTTPETGTNVDATLKKQQRAEHTALPKEQAESTTQQAFACFLVGGVLGPLSFGPWSAISLLVGFRTENYDASIFKLCWRLLMFLGACFLPHDIIVVYSFLPHLFVFAFLCQNVRNRSLVNGLFNLVKLHTPPSVLNPIRLLSLLVFLCASPSASASAGRVMTGNDTHRGFQYILCCGGQLRPSLHRIWFTATVQRRAKRSDSLDRRQIVDKLTTCTDTSWSTIGGPRGKTCRCVVNDIQGHATGVENVLIGMRKLSELVEVHRDRMGDLKYDAYQRKTSRDARLKKKLQTQEKEEEER